MLCLFVWGCRVFGCWRCQSILLTAWRSRWNRLGGGRGARCVGSAERVWDRRLKRIRDLGVSGRRTTLVWCRRWFICGEL